MKHKRGDTFDIIATIPQNVPAGYFAGWEVASQIRDPNNRLVADLVAVWADDTTTRNLRLTCVDTATWPLGSLEMDVQFKNPANGHTVSTSTITITVVRDITYV